MTKPTSTLENLDVLRKIGKLLAQHDLSTITVKETLKQIKDLLK